MTSIAIGVLALGCSQRGPAALPPAWVENHGGLAAGNLQQRAARLGNALASETFRGNITIRVLDSEVPGGYAWPNGCIFVTRGLMALTDDDELAAALAHEMGHLLADEGPPCLVALAGRPACSEGCEARADAMGCLLLRVKGRPAAAMLTLLRKVQTSPLTDPGDRVSMTRRIDILAAHTAR